MPRGTPRDWTLDELRLVWEHDGSDGLSPTDHARRLGVSYSTWYSIKSRLREEGGPEPLFERMQEDKKHRYNRASGAKANPGWKQPDTLASALNRIYQLRSSPGGRGGRQPQYTITVPPQLAKPFIDKYGQDVKWEPREDGLLVKPFVPPPLPEIPDWMEGSEDG